MKYMDYEPSSAKRVNRAPMRTTTELAMEFGVSVKSLAACIGNDKLSPSPVFKHQNKSNKNTWYNHKEMQKWWENRTAQK